MGNHNKTGKKGEESKKEGKKEKAGLGQTQCEACLMS